jgi:F-type H+-transporting ATPase subunit b
MLIDWFTVVAQATNFIILVWLMKRYLYGPIVAAIDTRERHIASRVEAADVAFATAKANQEALRAQSEELNQQCAAIISTAIDEAKAAGARMLEEATSAAAAVRDAQEAALRLDAIALSVALSRRIQLEAIAASRQILSELASANLEGLMVTVLVGKLNDLSGPAKQLLVDGICAAGSALVVRSAFEIDLTYRNLIRSAIFRVAQAEPEIAFEQEPELICGIEVVLGGQKVVWSVSAYLNSLEQNVAELLEQQWASPRGPNPNSPVAVRS